MQASNRTDKTVIAVVLAGGLGLGSGSLLAWLAPSDEFSWAGLAVLPLWFLLEVFFEVAGAVRAMSGVAALLGFYVAWFALRGFPF